MTPRTRAPEGRASNSRKWGRSACARALCAGLVATVSVYAFGRTRRRGGNPLRTDHWQRRPSPRTTSHVAFSDDVDYSFEERYDACAERAPRANAHDVSAERPGAALGVGGDVTASSQSAAQPVYGSVAARDGFSIGPFGNLTCASFTVSAFGEASESLTAYVLPSAKLSRILGADVSKDELLDDLREQSVAACGSSDFTRNVCAVSSDRLVPTTEYALHVENGDEFDVIFSVQFETCDGVTPR